MSVGLSEVGEESAFRCSSVCRSGLSARFRVCAACMRASVVRFHFSFWGSVCCFGGRWGGGREKEGDRSWRWRSHSSGHVLFDSESEIL